MWNTKWQDQVIVLILGCQLCLKLLSAFTHLTLLFDFLVQLDRQAAREQEELAESEAPPPAGALSFSRVSGLQRYQLQAPLPSKCHAASHMLPNTYSTVPLAGHSHSNSFSSRISTLAMAPLCQVVSLLYKMHPATFTRCCPFLQHGR